MDTKKIKIVKHYGIIRTYGKMNEKESKRKWKKPAPSLRSEARAGFVPVLLLLPTAGVEAPYGTR